MQQVHNIGTPSVWQTGPQYFLWLAVLLMPFNLSLEALKWQMLASKAQPLSFKSAFASYLAGLAFSIITPNRIGEYPGRILYLKRKNTFRLISVSILGGMSQMFSLFLFGLLGLIYYNKSFPGLIGQWSLAICIAGTVVVAVIYWRFEAWLPLLQKIKWLRKYNILGQLLTRFNTREQWEILIISLIRFAVFTAQYLFLLRWMNIYMPLNEGFCMAALFFWAIAIIPSIALAEVGERGQVSLYLFHHYSPNTVGILVATMGVWFLNLIIPSIIGSILLVRARFLQ